jgi:hypothetical protein
MTKNSPGKWMPSSGVMPLALGTRRVASTIIEQKSHLTRSPNWRTSYRTIKTMVSIVVHRVPLSMCLQWLEWTQEHKDHREDAWFILVWAIGALRLAADDPYAQEHPKSGGYNRV